MLLRFKQFNGAGSELEAAVNNWLAETEPDVTQMTQTQVVDGLAISFLYEESFRGQERRYAEESGMSGALVPAIPTDEFPDKPLEVPMEP